MPNIFIRQIETYLPENRVTNEEVEQKIKDSGYPITEGILASAMGCRHRYYAAPEEQASDLAVSAAMPIFEEFPKSKVDALIFASASSDLIEPATANIVQTKLGLSCPVFDLKNACNSMVNAIEVACALIQTDNYENILIASGEKPSEAIRFNPANIQEFKESCASYSLGDAGAALLLSITDEAKGFLFQRHQSVGENWQLCTIKGGGTMHGRDLSHYYFVGGTFQLREAFAEVAPGFLNECLKDSGFKMTDIDRICTHQVSMDTYDVLAEALGWNPAKIVKTFHLYGNTASTAVPLSMYYGLRQQLIKPGDLVLLFGLAAGIDMSFQLLRV